MAKLIYDHNNELIDFFCINDDIKDVMLPDEKCLELLNNFLQNNLIHGLFKNMDSVIQDKCPNIATSLSSWSTSFFQWTKLKYLKKSSLSEIFDVSTDTNDPDKRKKYTI